MPNTVFPRNQAWERYIHTLNIPLFDPIWGVYQGLSMHNPRYPGDLTEGIRTGLPKRTRARVARGRGRALCVRAYNDMPTARAESCRGPTPGWPLTLISLVVYVHNRIRLPYYRYVHTYYAWLSTTNMLLMHTSSPTCHQSIAHHQPS